MTGKSEFVNYLLENLSQLNAVRARAMFSGFGIFLDGVMFGLVANDELYLKTDGEINHYFDARQLAHFEYQKQGKPFKMSYRRCPESALDDPEILQQWALRSYQAAKRVSR